MFPSCVVPRCLGFFEVLFTAKRIQSHLGDVPDLSLCRGLVAFLKASSSPWLSPDTSTAAYLHLFAPQELLPVALELLIMGLLILSTTDWEIHGVKHSQPNRIQKRKADITGEVTIVFKQTQITIREINWHVYNSVGGKELTEWNKTKINAASKNYIQDGMRISVLLFHSTLIMLFLFPLLNENRSSVVWEYNSQREAAARPQHQVGDFMQILLRLATPAANLSV